MLPTAVNSEIYEPQEVWPDHSGILLSFPLAFGIDIYMENHKSLLLYNTLGEYINSSPPSAAYMHQWDQHWFR